MIGWTLGLTLIAAVSVLAAGATKSARSWLAGAPSEVRFWSRLALAPKLYLVDLHRIVARDRLAARMHICVAGGALAALLLTPLVHVFGIGTPGLAWLLLMASATLGAGAVLAIRRRAPRPARLSGGAFQRLPYSLAALALALFWLTLVPAGIIASRSWTVPLDATALVLFAWGVVELIGGMAWGPMKHALAGALHLVCHPRPARFSGGAPDAALQALDLGREKLGVEKPTDFTWNQLLGFDACVQCGRCELACPAFAAGLPLNPKKLIRDLAQASSAKTATTAGYSGSLYPGREAFIGRGGRDRPIVGVDAMVPADTLWACTTCRACVEECPMMIEHVDAIVDLRRFQTLELGATPGKGSLALADLKGTDNPGGRDPATRIDWASDLNLPLIAQKGAAEILLWMGDGAFELRNQRTLRSIVHLLHYAEVDYAILGNEECDTGDIARRLGDEAEFQRLARRNIEILGRYRFRRILTADPHVLHVLKNEYRSFGIQLDVAHHSAFFLELVREGRLILEADDAFDVVTYHDPCYLGRYNGEFASPRALLDALGIKRLEMERSRERSRCCGGGGGAPLTDVEGKRRIPDLRMDDVRVTGSNAVVVACPNCALMLQGVVEPRPEVVDIAELLLAGVERATISRCPR
jgi:dimethylglycine catabolism B